jgi:hypothetical protein
MTGDARFEDAAEAPLRLRALDPADLAVLSALAQDAVLTAADMRWDRRTRRFALLVNRFRWEDRAAAARRRRPFERVRSLILVGDAGHVAAQGIDRGAADTVLSLLSIGFEPGGDGAGRVILTFAGDGAVACDVECLDVALRDVTRPWLAQSARPPQHPETG